MKRKPWSLIIIALGYILAPLGNQFFNALWSPLPISFYLHIAFQPANITRNWPEWAFPFIAGVAIYICKKWSFFIYIIAMLSLFFASYLGYQGNSARGSTLELLFTYLVNVVLVGYFLIPKVREIYFNPRLRWWEADDRFRADLPASFKSKETSYESEIGNISISGLFLKSGYLPDDNEEISIHFEFLLQKYSFQGKVIRHGNQAAVGFGVRFQHTSASLRAAKQLAKSLAADGRLMASRQPTKEDGFVYWIKRLVTTGKGIIPERGPLK